MVLTNYTHEKDLADKENKVAQAEKKVQRTLAENDSSLAEKVSDAQTKEQSLVIFKQTLEHTQEQVAACVINAPGDGVVIYGSTAQSYYYRETPIQPGAKIQEQQLLVRLPDTSHMKAVAMIPEAMAMKLQAGGKDKKFAATVSIVGVAQPMPATITMIAVLPDNSNRWWDPDRKDYPVDLTLARTPPNLKPGVTARVQIVLEHLAGVLAVPLSSVYSDADDQYVFVRHGDQVKPQKVEIGQTTDTHAQIKSGLAANDEVLILQAGQGRELLEKAGLTNKSPATKPSTQPLLPSATQPTAAA
jgi:HlyD family secretion protein